MIVTSLFEDAVVNVSTSAQMAFVQPDGFQPTVVSGDEARTSTEYFPYFEVRKLKTDGCEGAESISVLILKVNTGCTYLCDDRQEL